MSRSLGHCPLYNIFIEKFLGANLGFIINSISFCLELDNKKNCKILFILRLLKKNDWYMIREFAQLLDTLRSLSDNIE